MAIRSLNRLHRLRALVTGIRRLWLRAVRGIQIDPTASLSLSSRFVPGRRGGISIGEESLVAFKTLLIAARPDGSVDPIRVGRRCFVGGGSVILPGVTIGDGSIVGAGAVVFDNVPPRTIVGGNPARVLRTEIRTGKFGRLEGADANSARLWR